MTPSANTPKLLKKTTGIGACSTVGIGLLGGPAMGAMGASNKEDQA